MDILRRLIDLDTDGRELLHNKKIDKGSGP